jgi:hypothetical protein
MELRRLIGAGHPEALQLSAYICAPKANPTLVSALEGRKKAGIIIGVCISLDSKLKFASETWCIRSVQGYVENHQFCFM